MNTSEWEKELEELLNDYKDAEISWGYGEPDDVANAIGDIKDFVRGLIYFREKEIITEVEKMKPERDETIGFNRGWNVLKGKVISILKH